MTLLYTLIRAFLYSFLSQLNSDINGKLYKDINNETASLSLKDATKYVCDNYVGLGCSARGRFDCAEGWFDYDLIKSTDDYCSGFLSGHTQSAAYQVYRSRGADAVLKKLGSDVKVVTKAVNYPFAGVNGEQTVDFTVDFGAVSGYTLAYAGITALDTFMSNGTIKYVQFSNLRISGTTATWSVHTARGTGYGNNGCTVQGIFIPA